MGKNRRFEDCSNPFQKEHPKTHAKKSGTKVSKIPFHLLSEATSILPELHLSSATHLCAACRMLLQREIKKKLREATDPADQQHSPSDSAGEDFPAPSSAEQSHTEVTSVNPSSSEGAQHTTSSDSKLYPDITAQNESGGGPISYPSLPTSRPSLQALREPRDQQAGPSSYPKLPPQDFVTDCRTQTVQQAGPSAYPTLPPQDLQTGIPTVENVLRQTTDPEYMSQENRQPTAPPANLMQHLDDWDPESADEEVLDPTLIPEFNLEQNLQVDKDYIKRRKPFKLSLSVASTDVNSKLSETNSSLAVEKINVELSGVLATPVKKKDLRRKVTLQRTYLGVKKNIKDLLTSVSDKVVATPKRDCKYCKKLVGDLAVQFASLSTKREKYLCLTSVPSSYGEKSIKDIIGCTVYEARKSVQLRNSVSHFTSPILQYNPHALDDNLKFEVIRYYLDSSNSRPSPNRRDTILISDPATNSRIAVSKHFILVSLDELYSEFLSSFPNYSISRAKFAQLRPKQCKWPGRKGRHNVCVCETHENFNLLSEALPHKLTVEDLVSKVLCEDADDECYLGFCDNCPNTDQLNDTFEEIRVDECVEYMQWSSTDSSNLVKVASSSEDFITNFKSYIPNLLHHHRIMKKQQEFITDLKDFYVKGAPGTVMAQVDFGQNYSFVIQNATQGYHWNNNQCTLHPFFVTFVNENSELDYKTYFAVSDCLDHDANSFHVFRTQFINLLKRDFISRGIPIQKIFYVSDGAASQYKNYKNWTNLLLHLRDYGITAEWHFFATSHGKSACDAMTAIAKRVARSESLKGRNVLSAMDFFLVCQEKLTDFRREFFFVSDADIKAALPQLQLRYRHTKTIPGTRSFHSCIPVTDTRLELRLLSSSTDFVTHVMGHVVENDLIVVPERFLAVRIQNAWQVCMVTLVDYDSMEFEAIFMKRIGRGNRIKWPELENSMVLPICEALCNIQPPVAREQTGDYAMLQEDYDLIRRKMSVRGPVQV